MTVSLLYLTTVCHSNDLSLCIFLEVRITSITLIARNSFQVCYVLLYCFNVIWVHHPAVSLAAIMETFVENIPTQLSIRRGLCIHVHYIMVFISCNKQIHTGSMSQGRLEMEWRLFLHTPFHLLQLILLWEKMTFVSETSYYLSLFFTWKHSSVDVLL